MLIHSNRHTKQDIEIWNEYEEGDIVHFEFISHKEKQSIESIKSFNAGYCGVSWGKDSVVLAHMVWRQSPETPLVHIRQIPTANPDCLKVRDAFLSRFDCQYVEMFADYRGCGKTQKELEGKSDRIFYECFKLSGSRYFSGIRADESAGRALRCRKFGHQSLNTCAPLAWWTAQDVFAYLAKHDLPVHPVYAMTGGGTWDRRKLRTDEIGGFRGRNFGRDEWEQQYYGDVLRKIQSLPSL